MQTKANQVPNSHANTNVSSPDSTPNKCIIQNIMITCNPDELVLDRSLSFLTTIILTFVG